MIGVLFMGGFFGTLASFFGKLNTFTTYINERLSATFSSLGASQKVALFLFFTISVLVVLYIIVLLFRFNFKLSTRKLKNIQREYQITLNRAEGKRCNFFWDIILKEELGSVKGAEDLIKRNYLILKLWGCFYNY